MASTRCRREETSHKPRTGTWPQHAVACLGLAHQQHGPAATTPSRLFLGLSWASSARPPCWNLRSVARPQSTHHALARCPQPVDFGDRLGDARARMMQAGRAWDPGFCCTTVWARGISRKRRTLASLVLVVALARIRPLPTILSGCLDVAPRLIQTPCFHSLPQFVTRYHHVFLSDFSSGAIRLRLLRPTRYKGLLPGVVWGTEGSRLDDVFFVPSFRFAPSSTPM